MKDILGVDASTQLDEGVLFDFDEEVAPILDTLIPRVLQISRQELEQEMYMEHLHHVRAEFARKRETEMQSILELERREMRKRDEIRARLDHQRASLAISKSALEKASTLRYTKSTFAHICTSAIRSLSSEGAFATSLLRNIREHFVPDILESAVLQARREQLVNRVQMEFNMLKAEYVPALIKEARINSQTIM